LPPPEHVVIECRVWFEIEFIDIDEEIRFDPARLSFTITVAPNLTPFDGALELLLLGVHEAAEQVRIQS
jgi:hypothetical protein